MTTFLQSAMRMNAQPFRGMGLTTPLRGKYTLKPSFIQLKQSRPLFALGPQPVPKAVVLLPSERMNGEVRIMGDATSRLRNKVLLFQNQSFIVSDRISEEIIKTEDCAKDLQDWGIKEENDICFAFFQADTKLSVLLRAMEQVIPSDAEENHAIATLDGKSHANCQISSQTPLLSMMPLQQQETSALKTSTLQASTLPLAFWVNVGASSIPVYTPTHDNIILAALRGSSTKQQHTTTTRLISHLDHVHESLRKSQEQVELYEFKWKAVVHSLLTAAAVGQFATLVYLTIEYEWDFMEPVCYFLGATLSCAGAFYFAKFGEEDTWSNLSGYVRRKARARGEKAVGLDTDELNVIEESKQRAIGELKRLERSNILSSKNRCNIL